jgi:T cell receptor alpha chain V region
VTQPEDHISVFEGAPVQVKCNYSYSGSPVLFWYVQYPRQGLQLLLKHTSGDSTKGFRATLNKAKASFHLQKPWAQEEDAAVYFCALCGTVTALAREAERKPFRVMPSTSCQPVYGHSGTFL